MADSPLVAVRKAVAVALKAHDFGVQFEVKESWKHTDEKLEDLKGVLVDVAPVGKTTRLITKVGKEFTVDIQVAVRKALIQDSQIESGEIANDEIDFVDSLQSAILEFLIDSVYLPTSRGNAHHILPPEEDQAYEPEHLRIANLFSGIETYRFTLII